MPIPWMLLLRSCVTPGLVGVEAEDRAGLRARVDRVDDDDARRSRGSGGRSPMSREPVDDHATPRSARRLVEPAHHLDTHTVVAHRATLPMPSERHDGRVDGPHATSSVSAAGGCRAGRACSRPKNIIRNSSPVHHREVDVDGVVMMNSHMIR